MFRAIARAIRSLLPLGAATVVVTVVAAACTAPSPQAPSVTPPPLATLAPAPTEAATAVAPAPVQATAAPSSPPGIAAPAAETPALPSPPSSPSVTPGAVATATPAPTPSPTAPPNPRPVPSATVSPRLLQVLQTIEMRVSAERGLTLPGQPDRKFLTREHLRDRLAQESQADQGDVDIDSIQEVLQLLGILKPGQDLRKMNQELQGDSTLGFFDPRNGDLVVVGDADQFGPVEEMTYAHEFTHALQHARFNLNALERNVRDDSEAEAGLTALIEGDATLSMFRYMARYFSTTQWQAIAALGSSGSSDIPSFLTEKQIFPYREGYAFVTGLFNSGGWGAVDQALANPPKSTSQIMHPDKYQKHQDPVKVTLPEIASVLGNGWSQRYVDIIGEFDLKQVLKVQLTDEEAGRAAEGWAGDRFVYLKGPAGEKLLVSVIAWDSPKEAGQFYDSYRNWLKSSGAKMDKGPSVTTWSAVGQVDSLRIKGVRTLLIMAPSGDVAAKVTALFPDV